MTVFLMILKIIGIILLVVLITALILLLLILFYPIGYKADGTYKDGDYKAAARVSWLFHILRIYFDMDNKGRELIVKALCFKIYPKEEKVPSEPSAPASTAVNSEKDELSEEQPSVEEVAGSSPEGEEITEQTTINEEDTGKEPEEPSGILPDDSQTQNDDDDSVFDKIKCKLSMLYDKITKVKKKIRHIMMMAEDERDQKAVKEFLYRIGILLKHILPRKGLLRLRFGLGNPVSTGEVLGFIYSFYPVYTNHLQLDPDFENKVMDADLNMKGHIQLIFVLIAGLRIYFNKDIRRLYRQIQKVRSE